MRRALLALAGLTAVAVTATAWPDAAGRQEPTTTTVAVVAEPGPHTPTGTTGAFSRAIDVLVSRIGAR